MYILAGFETDISGLNILSCKVDAVMSACVSVNRILTACVVISVIQTYVALSQLKTLMKLFAMKK